MEKFKENQKSFGEYAAQAETLYNDELQRIIDKMEELDLENLADDTVLNVEFDNTSFDPDFSPRGNETYKETMSVRALKDHLKNAYSDLSPEKWLESKQDINLDDPKDLLAVYESALQAEEFVVPRSWIKVE
ncbi:MAG TPA: hypothetical protein VL335_03095 [Candidatus Paceibacterota bacterium]|nr:hypothetical protein [Candidatus Paceibacterota bacterium]